MPLVQVVQEAYQIYLPVEYLAEEEGEGNELGDDSLHSFHDRFLYGYINEF